MLLVIFLREIEEGILIDVFVKPSSKIVNIIFDQATEGFIVAVKSSPTKGKANKEFLRIFRDFLERLGYKPAHLAIVRGHTSKNKIVLVKNINAAELRETLKGLLLD